MDPQDYRELLRAVAHEQAKLSTSAFFLDGQDRIRIRSFGSVTSCVLAVEARVLDAQGDCVAQAATHTPNTDRTIATTLLEFGDGFLLNIQVRATTSTPRVGQVYVILDIIRGQGATVQPLATLWSGYVTDTTPAGWPGIPSKFSTDGPGVLRSIAGTTPAAGAEISETVPTNARWTLQALRFQLVTSAAVANRVAAITLDDGATVFHSTVPPVVQAASLTERYSYSPGAIPTTALLTIEQMAPLPNLTKLMGAFRIRTSTLNIQGADQYSAVQYLVEEWIED